MDKELPRLSPNDEGYFESRIVDKLVKLYTTSGTAEWILLHLEVQHRYNKDFAERMYGYFNRLYERYKRPITAYVIFTEPGGLKRDNVFKMNCNGTTLEYTFNTYKIALQDPQALMQHTNPFALVVLIAKLTNLRKQYKNKHLYDQRLLEDKLQLANMMFAMQLPHHKENMLMTFLFYYVNFEIPETNAIFEREIKLLTNKNITKMTLKQLVLQETRLEGLREGIKVGAKRSKEEIVLRMIKERGFTDDQIVELAKVTSGLISRLRKKAEKIN
jgi:hypothetical protein